MKPRKRSSNYGKKLGPRSRDDIVWKAKNGLVLNLRELNIATGYGYELWRLWVRRGLPLVQGKISLKRALDWVRSEEMAPLARTSEVYNLCDKLASALFSVWIDLERRYDPQKTKGLREEIAKIRSEYHQLRRRHLTPVPLRAAPYQPLVEFEDRLPHRPVEQHPDEPVDQERTKVIQKGKDGLALTLKELAVATGYGYSTVLQWKRDGLPLIDGRITTNDALSWRRNTAKAKDGLSAEDHREIESMIPAALRRPRRPNEPPRPFQRPR